MGEDERNTRDDSRVTTGGKHEVSAAVADTISAEPSTPVASGETRAQIGRYRIVRRLGSGGMGVVWQATDPELARGVAIKVLHDGVAQPRLAERLRREAQALAKLVHPNVVTVYDVGEHAGELYIVMQLVTGTTFDRAIEHRTPREVIALAVQAGRGLVAAHAAGIVHRDFKPTNVLVDNAGTVRVSDFGLARASEATDEIPTLDGGGPVVEVSMTRGELVGTPAYMAPEQLLGGPVTHATDQFAFCVTLWEALAGERPFAGKTVGELREAVLAERRGAPPNGVSRRVVAAITRGLARDPKQRFPSMAHLLDQLEPNRHALWIAGGVGVAAIATTAILLGATRGETAAADPCRGVELGVDAVWNDPARVALARSLGTTAPGVLDAIDQRATRWKAAKLDACQASLVTIDPQPLAERDARYTCIDRSLGDLRAAIAVLSAAPDPRTIARAREVVVDGRDPMDCTRKQAVDSLRIGPIKHHVELDAELATTEAIRRAGRYEEFLKLQPTLEARVLQTGDHELAARFYLNLALARNAIGERQEAKDPMRRAAEAAGLARLDDLAARAWAQLADITAGSGDLEGADNVLVFARTAATRSENAEAQIWVTLAEARVAMERGELPAALAKCEAVLAAAKTAGIEDTFGDEGLMCVIDAQIASSDPAAIANATRNLARTTAAHGTDHPNTIMAERALAIALTLTGDTAGSSKHWERALAGTERSYGATSIELMNTLKDFAMSQTPGGAISTPQALAAVQRSVTIAEAKLAVGDLRRAAIYETLGYVQSGLHHFDAAAAAYDKAIRCYESMRDPMALARALYNAADVLKVGKRCDLAVPMFQRSEQVAAVTGAKVKMAAGAAYGIGTCLGASSQWVAAEAALLRSIAAYDVLEQVLFAAQSRWELADQLIKRGQKARGIAMAKDTVARLAGKPPPAAELAKQIVEWIPKQ
ncbi:MAG: serine/threonine-protein kinase [Kofleriaceae bacterium]